MRKPVSMLLVLALAGCTTGYMEEQARAWYIKPDMDVALRDQDFAACVRAGRGTEAAIAAGGLLAVPFVDAKKTEQGCMREKGYTYTPIGPDGKPWKP